MCSIFYPGEIFLENASCYRCDTAVSSQKRPKSVLDTDNPYQVACLPLQSFLNGSKHMQLAYVAFAVRRDQNPMK